MRRASLSVRSITTTSSSVTKLPAITLRETRKVTAFMRRESDAILHLHGSYEAPATCILGIRDYDTTLGNDVRDLLQRSLATFGRLLFIGCGGTFADPNFSALITWLRKNLGAAAPGALRSRHRCRGGPVQRQSGLARLRRAA